MTARLFLAFDDIRESLPLALCVLNIARDEALSHIVALDSNLVAVQFGL